MSYHLALFVLSKWIWNARLLWIEHFSPQDKHRCAQTSNKVSTYIFLTTTKMNPTLWLVSHTTIPSLWLVSQTIPTVWLVSQTIPTVWLVSQSNKQTSALLSSCFSAGNISNLLICNLLIYITHNIPTHHTYIHFQFWKISPFTIHYIALSLSRTKIL